MLPWDRAQCVCIPSVCRVPVRWVVVAKWVPLAAWDAHLGQRWSWFVLYLRREWASTCSTSKRSKRSVEVHNTLIACSGLWVP